MVLKKIVIVGNSVALRNRPHRPRVSKNYGQLIEEYLNDSKTNSLTLVKNLSFTRATMYDLYKIKDAIINNFGDLYIINIGVSDAATREIPRWFADILNRRRGSFIKNIFEGIHKILIVPFRPAIVKLRGKRAWTSIKNFEKIYQEYVDLILKNTNGKIICISLLNANERIEEAVPGTADNYKKFNNIIRHICEANQLTYLDLDDLVSDQHYPDGTHLSEAGNQEVASRILNILKENNTLNAIEL